MTLKDTMQDRIQYWEKQAKLDKEAYLLSRKYLKQAQRELKQLEIEKK